MHATQNNKNNYIEDNNKIEGTSTIYDLGDIFYRNMIWHCMDKGLYNDIFWCFPIKHILTHLTLFLNSVWLILLDVILILLRFFLGKEQQ